MATLSRAFTTLLCDDLGRTRAFYEALLELSVRFDSDWFVHLAAADDEGVELGLLLRSSELVPASEREAPASAPRAMAMLSLVVDDVDAVHERLLPRAAELGAHVVEAPRDLFYGQRRMLVRDPDGALVDLSSPCTPDPAWMQRVRPLEGGGFCEEPQ